MDLFQPCAPRQPRKLYSVQITHDTIRTLADQLHQGAIEDGTLVFVGGRRDGRMGAVTGRMGDWVVQSGALIADTIVVTGDEYHERFRAYPEHATR